MIRWYGSLVLISIVCLRLSAQQEIVWKGQTSTEIEAVYCDTLGIETDSISWRATILHNHLGRDSIATRVKADGSKQAVSFFYNERGDLIKRDYLLEDGSQLTFTWEYRYDEEDRLLEETVLDQKGELLAQYVAVYNEKGQLETAVNFVNHINDFTAWTVYYHDTGYKLEDPRYFSQANSYFYFNWKERRFYDAPDPFSMRPGEDMYQRFTYQYGKEGRLLWTHLYNKKRQQLEENRYYWNAELKLRSLKSTLLQRDSLMIVWDFRYDHQGRHYETNVFTNETGKLQRYNYEYEFKEGKLAKETRHYVGEALAHFYYGKHGELIRETRNDLLDQKYLELIFGMDGKIQKAIIYRTDEVPYEQLYYGYK